MLVCLHRLVQALVSRNRPHRNDPRKYEPSHECMHGKEGLELVLDKY
jgi:hypothetical protein